MKTTLVLDDRLMRRAKRLALDRGMTLTALIETALAEYIDPVAVATATPYRFEPIVRSGQPMPGVDPADRDQLYEIMEGRR
jgi:hypothetical protein